MSKLVNNPDFTGDTSLEEKGEEIIERDKEEKQPDTEEESESSDTSTEEDEGPKKRELEGLEKEDEKLASELSQMDKDIIARKQAIVDKRKARRVQKEALKEFPKETEEIDISDIDSADQERMDRFLKAKGYVPKSELQADMYKSTQRDVEESFFDNHPEYKPENDTGDVLYNAFREEFSLFAKPKTAKQVQKLLDRSHKAVQDKFPDRFPKKGSKSADAAKLQKKAIAGSGAGSTGTSTPKKTGSLTPEQKVNLQGFSEEELAEM